MTPCAEREKKSFLGAAIEIGQSIVVSSFYNEIACLGAQLYACSACNAVVEFVVYGLAVLFHGDVGVGVLLQCRPSRRLFFAVAKQETYLRTGMDEELQTAVLAEGQMCQEGYFHIVHGAV